MGGHADFAASDRARRYRRMTRGAARARRFPMPGASVELIT
jgi:hypothetical protein